MSTQNIVNIKSVSVSRCLHVLNNTKATFEVQFMKKLRNTEAELNRCLLKKASNSFLFFFQKQPPEILYKKGCSEKFRKFHKKKYVWKSLIKVLKASNFIKRDSNTGDFLRNLRNF